VDPWGLFALGTDGLTQRYCELNRLGEWLRQPANSCSSLAYVAAAIPVVHLRRNVPSSLRTLVAGSLVALGLGSAFFHASIALVAQKLDMAGTYGVVLGLIAVGLVERFRRIDPRAAVVSVLALDVVFYAFDFYLYGPWLLPLLIVVAIAVLVASRIASGPGGATALGVAFGGLGVGGAAWILDDHKVACAPVSPLQWHALWHIATAVALAATFRFFDRPRKELAA
jgi:hypothetical protein